MTAGTYRAAIGMAIGLAACEPVVFIEQADAFDVHFVVEGEGRILVTEADETPLACEDGERCKATYSIEDQLFIVPDTLPQNRLLSWKGCSAVGSVCILDVAATATVTASFAPKYHIEVHGPGAVRLEPGPTCEATTASVCELEQVRGMQSYLRAVPADGAAFVGFEGDCAGAHPVCRPDQAGRLVVRAYFRERVEPLLYLPFDGDTRPMGRAAPSVTVTNLGEGELTASHSDLGEALVVHSSSNAVALMAGAESLSGLAEMSVCAWVRPDLIRGAMMLVSKSVVGTGNNGDDSFILQLTDGHPAASVWPRGRAQASTVPQPSLPTGRWTHLCLTHDGQQAYLWSDGELITQTPARAPSQKTPHTPLVVGGCHHLTPTATCDRADSQGALDEVYLYDVALTTTEIRGLADSPRLGPWTVAGEVLGERRQPRVVLAEGQLVVLGGQAGSVTATVSVSLAPAADGRLERQRQDDFSPRKDFGALVLDEWVVLLGGTPGYPQRARILGPGRLGQLEHLSTQLPLGQGASALALGDFVYVVGDVSHVMRREELVVAPASSTLQIVEIEGLSRLYPALVQLDARRFLIVGAQLPTTETLVVEPAADGSVNAASVTPGPELPLGLSRTAAVFHEGRVYVIGGQTEASGFTSQVFSARYLGEGRLGPWRPAGALAHPRAEHDAVVHDGKLYVVGGRVDDGGSSEQVLVTLLPAP